MSKTIYIGGRLESKEKGNVVTGANAILDDTKGKKQNVINKETDDELLRLEQSKQDNLNFDNAPTENSTNPVTSGGVYTAEKALSDAIEAILLLIPSAATALNKLVDTNTMNSSISTATATFRGTYNAVSDLGLTYQATHAQIEAALDALGLTADNNDFAFVQIPVSDQSQDIAKTERFKFNGTNWLYEYDLNTSGFTAAQWAAINSGITVALVTKLTDLPTATALQLALNGKQDTLTFDNEPTALSQNPVTSGGIYLAIQAVATDLSNYSETTDGRLNTLEGLVPTEASSSNKLTDKAYVDGLIQAITELIPAEADTTNQLADKAYVLAQILAATPAFKGQFTTLAELQAVVSPKDGDLGIVRTKDSDGMDVFTVYQYLSNAWNVFYSLSYHPQTKPATTGTTGDYPYNGMGRVELAKNMVGGVNTLTQDMFYKGAVGSRVPNTNTIFVIRYDYVLAENITIPDNCVLEFEGGSISGAYTVTGQNTGIIAPVKKIAGLDIIFAGTWKVDVAYPLQFGATGDGVTNDTKAFQNALLVSDYIYTHAGTYIIDGAGYDRYDEYPDEPYYSGIWISRSNVTMEFEKGAVLKKTGIKVKERNAIRIAPLETVTTREPDIYNIHIKGGEFVGNRKDYTGTSRASEENSVGLLFGHAHNVTLDDCYIHDFQGDSVGAYDCTNVTWRNIKSENARRCGYAIATDDTLLMEFCTSSGDGTDVTYDGILSNATLPKCCIDIETDGVENIPANNVVIRNCVFDKTGNVNAIVIGNGSFGNGILRIEECEFITSGGVVIDHSSGTLGTKELYIENNVVRATNDTEAGGNSFVRIQNSKTNLLSIRNNKVIGKAHLVDLYGLNIDATYDDIIIEGNETDYNFARLVGTIKYKRLFIDNNICGGVKFFINEGGNGTNTAKIISITKNKILASNNNMTGNSIGLFLLFNTNELIVKENVIISPASYPSNAVYSFLRVSPTTSAKLVISGNYMEAKAANPSIGQMINEQWNCFPGVFSNNILRLPNNEKISYPNDGIASPMYIVGNIIIGSNIPITDADNAMIKKQGNVTD